jgi:hypothetical protein
VGWLVLLVRAMSFQVGILFVIIVNAITSAIAPAQQQEARDVYDQQYERFVFETDAA